MSNYIDFYIFTFAAGKPQYLSSHRSVPMPFRIFPEVWTIRSPLSCEGQLQCGFRYIIRYLKQIKNRRSVFSSFHNTPIHYLFSKENVSVLPCHSTVTSILESFLSKAPLPPPADRLMTSLLFGGSVNSSVPLPPLPVPL